MCGLTARYRFLHRITFVGLFASGAYQVVFSSLQGIYARMYSVNMEGASTLPRISTPEPHWASCYTSCAIGTRIRGGPGRGKCEQLFNWHRCCVLCCETTVNFYIFQQQEFFIGSFFYLNGYKASYGSSFL